MDTNGDLAQAVDAFQRGDLERARSLACHHVEAAPSAQWKHLLGLIHCRLGHPEDGLAHLEAALREHPANVQYRTMFVRALIDCGRAREALTHARRPPPGPAAAALWKLRAEAAAAADSLADRSEALYGIELEETVAKLQDDPGDVSLQLRRAHLLGALGRAVESSEIYRQVLAGNPGNAEAVRGLGLLLERENRVEELRRLVEAAVDRGCDRESFALLEALIAWREGKPEDALGWLSKVDRDEDRLRASELETRAQDALGDADAAFGAVERRNRAMPDRDEWRESARAFREELRSAAAVITPHWAESWKPAHTPSERPPVFLVGFPRSGTTLLDTFLMGHPDIYVLEEIPILGLVAERVGSIAAVATLDEVQAAELSELYLRSVAAHVPEGFEGTVIDKMPLNMLWAPLARRLFPTAKFLFAQRHPCDCVLSCLLQRFGLNPAMANFLDVGDAADFYDLAAQVWARSEDSLALAAHRVVYERLVEDPAAELRAAIAFLGLDWVDSLADHRSTAKARGAISTPSYDQVVQPVTPRAVGRWRRYEKQLEPALPKLLPWAERLGYET